MKVVVCLPALNEAATIAAVLDGIPDHRDYILSESEKASNKVMQICISRAKTKRLVLDL